MRGAHSGSSEGCGGAWTGKGSGGCEGGGGCEDDAGGEGSRLGGGSEGGQSPAGGDGRRGNSGRADARDDGSEASAGSGRGEGCRGRGVFRGSSANSARQDPRLARSTGAPQQKTPQQKTPQQQTGPTGRRSRALPRTVANLPPWTCHVNLSRLEPWKTRRSCCGLVHHSRGRSCAPAVQVRRRLSPWLVAKLVSARSGRPLSSPNSRRVIARFEDPDDEQRQPTHRPSISKCVCVCVCVCDIHILYTFTLADQSTEVTGIVQVRSFPTSCLREPGVSDFHHPLAGSHSHSLVRRKVARSGCATDDDCE